jgi:hypothetical protein
MTHDKLIFGSFDDDEGTTQIAELNSQGYELVCIYPMDQSSSFIVHMSKYTPPEKES